jgi:hypothetical protein
MPSPSQLLRVVSTAVCAALALASAPVAAQTWPTKPITLIVPFPAGGTTDVLARIFAERMSADLGQRVVVDNRGTAGGTTAAAFVARSAPDGYTLFISNVSTHALAPNLYKNLTYDTLTAFAPVSLMTTSAGVLIAHPSLKPANARELVKLVKANPGKFNYASPGNGTGGHLGMERFRALAGSSTWCMLFRLRPGAQRRARRRAGHGREHPDGDLAAPDGQAAGARGRRRQAVAGAARRADHGRAGLPLNVSSWTAFFVRWRTPQPIIERLHASGGGVAPRGHPAPAARPQHRERGVDAGRTRGLREGECDGWGGIIRAQGLKIDN